MLIPKTKSLFYAEGKGLPIGNLTSQFFANVYLNELDQFVTKKLGFEKYIRYVDDFVIVGADREVLRASIEAIDMFLRKNLDLNIHRGKILLQDINHGVDFLGYFVKPTHTLVRQKVVKRFKNKLYRHKDREGFLPLADIPMIQSYLGHFGHANSYRLRKKLGGENQKETRK